MLAVSKTRLSHFHQNYRGLFPAVTASNEERNGILLVKCESTDRKVKSQVIQNKSILTN